MFITQIPQTIYELFIGYRLPSKYNHKSSTKWRSWNLHFIFSRSYLNVFYTQNLHELIYYILIKSKISKMLRIPGITFINDCQMIGKINNLNVFMSKKTKIFKYDQLRSHICTKQENLSFKLKKNGYWYRFQYHEEWNKNWELHCLTIFI